MHPKEPLPPQTILSAPKLGDRVKRQQTKGGVKHILYRNHIIIETTSL